MKNSYYLCHRKTDINLIMEQEKKFEFVRIKTKGVSEEGNIWWLKVKSESELMEHINTILKPETIHQNRSVFLKPPIHYI
jgi:hypothetical protein